MRRIAVLLAALGLMLALGAPQAFAKGKPNEKFTSVQLLAINDLHGHLQPTTPGTIQVGCCNAVRNSAGDQTGWAPKTVPAGGIARKRPAGKRMEKAEPAPGLLSMASSAPCRCATCLTMASPKPVPPVSRERLRSMR